MLVDPQPLLGASSFREVLLPKVACALDHRRQLVDILVEDVVDGVFRIEEETFVLLYGELVVVHLRHYLCVALLKLLEEPIQPLAQLVQLLLLLLVLCTNVDKFLEVLLHFFHHGRLLCFQFFLVGLILVIRICAFDHI